MRALCFRRIGGLTGGLLGLGLLAACSSTTVVFEKGQGTSSTELRILCSVAERGCQTQLADVGKVQFTVTRKGSQLTGLALDKRHSGNRQSHRSVELPLNLASLCLALEIEEAPEEDEAEDPVMTLTVTIEPDLMGDTPRFIEEALKPHFTLSIDGKERYSGELPTELKLTEGADLEIAVRDSGPEKYLFKQIYPRPVKDAGEPLRVPYEVDRDEVCERADKWYEEYRAGTAEKEIKKAEDKFCGLWEEITEYQEHCKVHGLRRWAHYEKKLCND